MYTAIVGLGNTGSEYEKTYHNVGDFVAGLIADLAAKEGMTLKLYPISGYMNESGVPVSKWLKMNNLSVADVIVAHDDSDLPVGEYRIAQGGGSAGHKGIESLVAHLGTEDFLRLRIGIRDPNEQVRKKAGDFVLRQWSGAEEEIFRAIATAAWARLQGLK